MTQSTVSQRRIAIDRLADVPGGVDALPSGWLTDLEARVLYNAALAARGPIIEIGSWIGRSTCALAYGVRDNRGGTHTFDVFDYGVAGIAEFQERFGEDPRTHASSETFLRVIMHPGGTPALLKQNLSDRGLDRHINLMAFGDFRSSGIARVYDIAFCDACHDVAEIEKNVPALEALMNQSDYLMLFDDVWSEEQLALVCSIVRPDVAVRIHPQDYACKLSIAARGAYARDVPWIAPL